MQREPTSKRSTAGRVMAWEESVVLPTYEPAPPDRNPMFLEKRVYQGSSGKVYPIPFTDRIAESSRDRRWRAVWIENEFLRVMILPEIGGRIHRAVDKTNGHDFIYHQHVIKPALVGLAGPWISGGIEFNWPQHHRPATFMPVEIRIEEHADGSKTVWASDHDPMVRMKGMHGVCLHPGKAFIELRVRAYNRTPFVQTFLWWANVATQVHEAYQSFFPPDVHYVADHAKRAMSEYPRCRGSYYGVDYGTRGKKGVPLGEIPSRFVPPHCREAAAGRGPVPPATGTCCPAYAPDDLSWYANIPTPCSYMCMGSKEDFFGGYDHTKRVGIVHVASHHISPGKKQWTWGNHEFGYAWDRNLTDEDGPYIELMAGVYTDNQPDFSFLGPGETRTWSQYWYPIQEIGPARHANLDAALSFSLGSGAARIGVAVSSAFEGARIEILAKGKLVRAFGRDLAPGSPLLETVRLRRKMAETDLRLRVLDRRGREIIAYSPRRRMEGKVPPPATEPPAPEDIASADELYLTGLHLEQYRHATRSPTAYWLEALRRDPLDARCNNAMGLWHLRRGELSEAEGCFRKAIERLTRRNPNPRDGEAWYDLGLCLRYRLDALPAEALGPDATKECAARLFEESYAAFYKATWNQAWQPPAFHALAELDCRRGDWSTALGHLDRALRGNPDDLRARDLKAIVLRKLGRDSEARGHLRQTLALDPLDGLARHLLGKRITCDTQTRIDFALDLARAGLHVEAIRLLSTATPEPISGTAPLVGYHLGWLRGRLGDSRGALREYRRAAAWAPDYCFPARLEEIAVLEDAIRARPRDARAPLYLGNLLYDRRRHAEAIRLWERSARLDPSVPVVWRNLGIGYFNVLRKPERAKKAYEKAFRADPRDARIVYERDQLWKRTGVAPERRLRELERHPDLVERRDDLSVEICALYNQTGLHEKALAIIERRRFQPWEGGEGLALGQHTRTHLALGRRALERGEPVRARKHFEEALESPHNLGESKHLLANQSDIRYWLGLALDAIGDTAAARRHWRAAAGFRGDFQEMSVRAFSEMTYFSALSWGRLGRRARMRRLLSDLLAYARRLRVAPARIDYFATSLPAMLLFEEDIQLRQETTALFLEAQARLGLGDRAAAKRLLSAVLRRDPNHALANDLRTELRSTRKRQQGGP